MEIKENFDSLSRDAREFIDLKIEEVKLSLVERLSLLFADALSWLLVMVLLALALLCLMAAFVAVLTYFVGLLLALLVTAVILLVAAYLLYTVRGNLFGNRMVARLYKVFFYENQKCDEDE